MQPQVTAELTTEGPIAVRAFGSGLLLLLPLRGDV
jgi:hypothetical protein